MRPGQRHGIHHGVDGCWLPRDFVLDGRGTPFGAPAPTLKVFTNQRLCDHKANWMDFNAGVIATGERTLDEAARDLYQLVLQTASGKLTSAERRGCHEISIWKDGVCL